jgi:1,4-alpha-glucan branching enzyme
MNAERRRMEALANGSDGDPFSFLGMHQRGGGVVVRVFRPRAEKVWVVEARDPRVAVPLERVHPAGIFAREFPLTPPFPYRIRERSGGAEWDAEDVYAFGPVLGAIDAWLIAEGSHLRLWEALGAHVGEHEGVHGTRFAVWAPSARRVSVVGDFNAWDGRVHPMRSRAECGVWELFLPFDLRGHAYKYEIAGPSGGVLPLHADPFARQAEVRPQNASVVAAPSSFAWTDDVWQAGRAERAEASAPMSIYEVHLGSWRRKGERGTEFFTYRESADTLLPYVRDLGFTHVELMPVMEHPFDGSWGYQVTGLFAPTSRYGTPDDFRYFVDRAHAEGIGVILDWVPGHFPTDAHGLGNFDGTHLYEHADPRKGFHFEWGTFAYNHGRREVANFLLASALYWLGEFHADGLRVDAVSSLIYLDYERDPGQWVPNDRGDNENIDATTFLRRLNETVHAELPGSLMIAEESTSWPMITGPVENGGLGFDYKWNMGWMNDTLRLFKRDPFYRGYHWEELTFGLTYAFDERFILPFSHDEVVHLKGSLLGRMPGNDDARFAGLRLLLAYTYAHPGKKLLFMGGEFGQEGEWSEARSLDWHLLDAPRHRGISRLVADLNALYVETPALYGDDDSWAGFAWIECDDRESLVAAFVRTDPATRDAVTAVLNLSGREYARHRLAVPEPGRYREILNTDAERYGGRNRGNFGEVRAVAAPSGGATLDLYVPPLSALWLRFEPEDVDVREEPLA